MTEPGTSLLGKAVRFLLPFLTSGLTWSAGMKSCTGRRPSSGEAVGRTRGRCCRHSAGGGAHRASLGLWAAGPQAPLTGPASPCSLCFPRPATKCSWKARCGGKAWGSSSYRSCSSWPTGKGACPAASVAHWTDLPLSHPRFFEPPWRTRLIGMFWKKGI